MLDMTVCSWCRGPVVGDKYVTCFGKIPCCSDNCAIALTDGMDGCSDAELKAEWDQRAENPTMIPAALHQRGMVPL